MAQYKLGEIETAFANLIWDNEPMTSGQLAALCGKKLGWKKSTTYTVLRKLCDRGIFQNEGGMVTSRISREEFIARRSEEFVEEEFDGSLPGFLAAFTRRKKLNQEEIGQLQRLIDESKGGT